jgi:hypothetical protein
VTVLVFHAVLSLLRGRCFGSSSRFPGFRLVRPTARVTRVKYPIPNLPMNRMETSALQPSLPQVCGGEGEDKRIGSGAQGA